MGWGLLGVSWGLSSVHCYRDPHSGRWWGTVLPSPSQVAGRIAEVTLLSRKGKPRRGGRDSPCGGSCLTGRTTALSHIHRATSPVLAEGRNGATVTLTVEESPRKGRPPPALSSSALSLIPTPQAAQSSSSKGMEYSQCTRHCVSPQERPPEAPAGS